MAVKKDPRTIELAEPFVSLFPVEPDTLALVKASMREHGYQADKPILLWKDAFGERGRQVLVDGHTRLRAALELKLPEIWATVRQFKDVDAAITAGIGEQVIRRNLNREQIAAYVVAILPLLDEKRGGLRTRTAKQLAALLGVSIPTIDRARGVIGSGDTQLVEQVLNGEVSLLAAYDLVTGRVAPEPVSRRERLEELEASIAGAARQPAEESDEAEAEESDEAEFVDDHPYDPARAELIRTEHEFAKLVTKIDYLLFGVKIEEIPLDEDGLHTLECLLDHALYMQDIAEMNLVKLRARFGEHGLREKIRKLRSKTVANGCPRPEADSAARMADRLEDTLAARLAARN